MHSSHRLCNFVLNASCNSCSVRVFSTSCDSALIASVASKWRETGKLRGGGVVRKVSKGREGSHVVFGKTFPGEKGNVMRCVVMQLPVLLSPKLRAKCSHLFAQSPDSVRVVRGMDCLACQDEFFEQSP
jgi:hypothetical protein